MWLPHVNDISKDWLWHSQVLNVGTLSLTVSLVKIEMVRNAWKDGYKDGFSIVLAVEVSVYTFTGWHGQEKHVEQK